MRCCAYCVCALKCVQRCSSDPAARSQIWITPIPHICHFFNTNTFLDQKILHSKVRKFATKIASRQNSVNFDKNYFAAKMAQIVGKMTHCV